MNRHERRKKATLDRKAAKKAMKNNPFRDAKFPTPSKAKTAPVQMQKRDAWAEVDKLRAENAQLRRQLAAAA